jgi:NAD(P)-dependent dehydrogenase (short-subunit alcohol dehydrogenase family)
MSWSALHTVYGTAKAALNHLICASAMELAPLGVRVNVVAPGVVRTPRVQRYIDDGHGKEAVDYHPLGRLAIPADVAGAILFMATDLSRNVTGQTLLADGGLLAQSPMPDSVWFSSP